MHSVDQATTPRRSALFDHVVELILAEGFAHLTGDQIAARLHCSKTTLYTLAASREQLVVKAVVHFFRHATERIERRLKTSTDPRERLGTYLQAVADELAPASAAFYDDVAGFQPAREMYEMNTRFAASRVRDLIAEGVASGSFRQVNAAFVADVTSAIMARIQQRQLAHSTGLADAEAYSELAALVVHGITS